MAGSVIAQEGSLDQNPPNGQCHGTVPVTDLLLEPDGPDGGAALSGLGGDSDHGRRDARRPQDFITKIFVKHC